MNKKKMQRVQESFLYIDFSKHYYELFILKMQIDFPVKTDKGKDKHTLIFLKKRNKIINIF